MVAHAEPGDLHDGALDVRECSHPLAPRVEVLTIPETREPGVIDAIGDPWVGGRERRGVPHVFDQRIVEADEAGTLEESKALSPAFVAQVSVVPQVANATEVSELEVPLEGRRSRGAREIERRHDPVRDIEPVCEFLKP